MKTTLRLLPLEDRLTPAASVRAVGGNLFVTGDNAANTITLTTPVAGQVSVTVNGTKFGSYAAGGNVQVTTGNSADRVNVNLSKGIGGTLFVSTGNGNDTVDIGGGTLQGALNITTGAGNDSVNIGAGGPVPSFGSGATAINGFVTAVNLGVGTDEFTVSGNTRFAGTLVVSGAQSFLFGDGTAATADGPVVVTAAGEGLANETTFEFNSVVNGPLTVVGGVGGDSVNLFGQANGQVTVVGGDGSNSVQVGTGETGGGIAGNFNVVGGNGSDVVETTGDTAISGSVGLYLGNGDNTVSFGGLVSGGVGVTGGNGADAVTLEDGSSTQGNLALNLGNGTNSFTKPAAAAVSGGRVSYAGGGGTDSVSLGGTNAFRFTASLGAGADSVTFLAGTTFGGATLDFGAGTDSFTDNGVVVVWPQTLRDLP